MNPRSVSLGLLLAMAAASGTAMAQSRNAYIVQLAAEPVATYNGTVAGYARSQPTPGARFNSRSSAALAYSAYLDAQQTSVTALVRNAPVLARYNTVYNGFAALLTPAEVQALKASPLVVEVHPDAERKMDTISTATFLGLTAPGGVWSQVANGLAVKGENIVIGVVDGGVWPENRAYADRVNGAGEPTFSGGSLAYQAPVGWNGACDAGEGFVPSQHCNNKLIGARFFNAGWLANSGQGRPAYPAVGSKHWTEFFSPRDSVAGATGQGGHGTHTSSTAGGNANNPAVVSGLNMGPASGVAPRARLAVYKVCYTAVDPAATDGTGTRNSCFISDSVAAIDKAVADGVHVINFSISGSQTSVNDPVEQAFLRAAKAGVFVATSAGNSGPTQPTPAPVAHISPWLTTVAASTHDRDLRGTVTLGNGASYSGSSMNAAALAATPLIRSVDAKLAAATTANANLCFLNTLDPVKTAGKVVVCTRGTNARVEKSLAVFNAGGVGMVLVDNGAGLVAEAHSVPTVHINAADGALVAAYAQTAGATAAIGTFFIGVKPAPLMAGFSSRGPNAGDPDMLKPDLTAPGVDVIAAVTADLSEAQRNAVAAGSLVPVAQWASYQGTSMSSPHVAGLAALLRQAHPTWSPAAIKSALMTTAYTTLNDGQTGQNNGLLPWAQGAGHVAPNRAINPGLVYDAGATDFTRYQCKANRAAETTANCNAVGTLDQTYNFNLPSITVGAVVGSTTVTRRVTNVGSSTASYSATVALSGFNVEVTPPVLTNMTPGETRSFTVKLTPAGAADNVWSFGSLTWADGTHVVRSPLTVRTGKSISADALITGTTASGTRLITVRTGFAGRMTANKGGMKAATLGGVTALTGATLTSAQLRTACVAGTDTASVKVYPVTIPPGTIAARFALRDAEVGASGDDNDMGVLAPSGTFTYSGNEGSNESVTLAAPAAGNYKVCVVAYEGAPVMTHRLRSTVVTTADASNSLNVLLPGAVFSGSTATVGVAWSGLNAGAEYLGGFQLKDASGVVQTTTIVRVDTTAAVPLAVTERAPSAKAMRE
jgi:subtilisin family serine protease